jgi:hypothetical protein
MPRTADYFGLMAYMFVMYGGLPGADTLWLSDSEASRQAQRPKLKVVAANDAPKRRSKAPVAASEAAA